MRYVEATAVILFWFSLAAAFFVVRGVGGFIRRLWDRF